MGKAEENKSTIETILAEPTVAVQEVKKPRAFVGGDDIFDFSGLKSVNNNTESTLNISKPSQQTAPTLGSKVVNLSAPK
jgi:hypothetical protein